MSQNDKPVSQFAFQKGTRSGVGHQGSYHKQSALIREAVMNAVTPQDVDEIIHALMVEAKNGNVIAARELFDRWMGKAVASIEISKVESESDIKNLSREELLKIAQGAAD